MNLGCAGTFETFNTIQSEQFGNDYFMRCNGCGTQVALIYKNTKPEFRQ